MKKISVLLSFFILANFSLFAQTDFNNIRINDSDLVRNDNLMSVFLDMDFTDFNVRSNRAVLLTPYIVNGENSQAFPSLGFYGKNRYYYYKRNDMDFSPNTVQDAYIESEIPDYIPYSASVRYESWMTGGTLVIERKVFGCCGDILDEDRCVLEKPEVYVPDYLYIRPPHQQTRKERSIEGYAYVDFPVSQTVIYPEYHNNVEELAKIRNTVDSVRLDKDVEVTSIFIKGYASPESPYDNNTRLAKGRTEAIRNYVLDMYDFDGNIINTSYEPENWEGLREYLVNSSLPYKSQIINLIDKDEEPDRKEWLIKSRYQDDYKYLLENCYPYLRRTYYRIDYVVRSFTEGDVDRIRELVTTRPQNLSLEEFYLASQDLDPESELFGEIFDVAVRMYPQDPIANLNAANVAMQRGDLKTAKKFIERAGNISEAIYSRGVLAVLCGDLESAKGFFITASALGIPEADVQLKKMSF